MLYKKKIKNIVIFTTVMIMTTTTTRRRRRQDNVENNIHKKLFDLINLKWINKVVYVTFIIIIIISFLELKREKRKKIFGKAMLKVFLLERLN